jgi:hypothetical protein
MECGTARIEITPPFETPLFGYPVKDRSYTPHKDKVIDPLHARVLYLKNESGKGVLILSLDLCILLTPDARALRSALANEVGISSENILVACTHTHSAPLARLVGKGRSNESISPFMDDPEDVSLRYGKWLLGRLKKICAIAIARKSPVSVSHRETTSGLGYNRRCLTDQGVLHCWNIHEFPSRHAKPMEGLKHCVLIFDYMGKAGGVILQNAGIHPVVLGKESREISSDWPFYSRRHIEKRMGGYQAIFTMGAGAQVHPWIATQTDTRGLKLCGEAIGAEAVLLASATQPMQIPERALQPTPSRIPGTQVEITTLEIGELLLVALPLELSATWADAIQRQLNRPVLFVCLCNGWDGYWMSPDEFAEGGYEVEIAKARGVTAANSIALLEHLKTLAR